MRRREREEVEPRGERGHEAKRESAVRKEQERKPTGSAHRTPCTRESGSGREEERESKPSASWTRRERESGRAFEPADQLLRRRIRDAIDRNGIWKASRSAR